MKLLNVATHFYNYTFLALILFFLFTPSCKRAENKATPPNNNSTTTTIQSYRAGGNEPFWSVHITSNVILWKTPENELTYPYNASTEKGDTLLFETNVQKDTLNSRLKIYFIQQKCQDSMSGIESSYTVRVERDGEAYEGCGNVETK